MKQWLRTLGGVALAAVITAPAEASSFNVAEGKPVTASAVVGVMTCCWAPGPLAPLSSVTDGIFLPEQSVWQTNTVWWDEFHPPSANNVLEIDLLGNYTIDQLILQADNNDFYGISYRNWGGTWVSLGAFGPVAGFGMMTRTSAYGLNLHASAFRIDAFGGDAFYSVSEFQAIPEPSVLALLGLGVAGAIRRRMAA